MNLREIGSVTAVGLSSIPARMGTSLVIVAGLAAVVAVLVSALTIAESFTKTATSTGRPDRAFVVNNDRETSSVLSRADALTISNAPGIRKTAAGDPLLSMEYVTLVSLKDPRTSLNTSAAVRGVGARAGELRPGIKLVEGRWFKPGAHELVIGRTLQRRLGLGVGGQLRMPNGKWPITGVFTSEGDARESELQTDVETLMNVNRRTDFNSMTLALESNDAFTRFKDAVTENPSVTAKVFREDEFYATATGGVSSLLRTVAYGVGALMAIGALFAALNTMYTAVSTRTGEIGTLRAMGFGPGAVGISIVIEALLLALAGALLGALVAWLLLDGATMSTMSGMSHSQLSFGLHVGTTQLLEGIACALLVAAIGGALAAGRAARLTVVEALRGV